MYQFLRNTTRQAHTEACRRRLENELRGTVRSDAANRRTTEYIARSLKKADDKRIDEEQQAAKTAKDQDAQEGAGKRPRQDPGVEGAAGGAEGGAASSSTDPARAVPPAAAAPAEPHGTKRTAASTQEEQAKTGKSKKRPLTEEEKRVRETMKFLKMASQGINAVDQETMDAQDEDPTAWHALDPWGGVMRIMNTLDKLKLQKWIQR